MKPKIRIEVEIEYPDDYDEFIVSAGTRYAEAIEKLIRTGSADNSGCGPGVFVSSHLWIPTEKKS